MVTNSTQDVGPISPAQSDALDDLLLKFVELDKPAASGPAAAVLNSSIDMSLRGDSEWIEARP